MSKRAILPFVLLACTLSGAQPDPPEAKDKDTPASKTSHRPHFRLGGIMIGAGYTRFAGPWYPYYGYHGLAAPYYYSPYYYGWDPFFYHPYYNTGFISGPGMGEIKLRTGVKNAEVFLDGAYAGTASERKSMWLDPGVYSLEIRAGKETYSRRVYVLSGKALRVNAKLEAHP